MIEASRRTRSTSRTARHIAVALGIATLAFAIPATAAKPHHVSGSGNVEYPNGQREFSVNAKQTGAGTEATGSARVNNFSRKFNFEGLGVLHIGVSCLRVEGNVAFMSGEVTLANPDLFWAPGTLAWFMVTDNGQGKKAAPDTISSVYLDGFEENDEGEPEFWSVNDCTEDIPRPVGSPGWVAGQMGPNALDSKGNIRVR